MALAGKQSEKMKISTYLLTATGVALLVSATPIHAADDWTQRLYVNADAGGIFQQDGDFHQTGAPTFSTTFNPGLRTDIALGYNLTKSFAVELEPGFMWNSVDTLDGYGLGPGDSIDLYSIPVLANLVYKFETHNAWTPYVGVGVGANIGIFDGSLHGSSFQDTDVAFAYQAEAGLKYSFTDHVAVGLAYKFYGTTDQNYDLQTAVNYTDHASFSGVYIHGIFANVTWNF